MKTPLIPFMLLVSAACASCQEKSDVCVNFKVADDAGVPVQAATLTTAVFDYWLPGESFGKDIYHSVSLVTDNAGAARFAAASSRCEYTLFARKPGHYESQCFFKSTKIADGRWEPWNPTIKVELKRVLKPIPLIAKKVVKGYGECVSLPADKASYDLEMGDWVAPHGIGKTADLIFNIKQKAPDPGKNYETTLTLSFSNPQDGLVMVERPKEYVSSLVMPYEAPATGYQTEKSWRKQRVNPEVIGGKYKDGKLIDETKPNEDYFLRLRTKLDEKGKLVSANYAKVQGSFMWGVEGVIRFQYHFNPTPNNRNLEFDQAKNIFKVDERQKVTEP